MTLRFRASPQHNKQRDFLSNGLLLGQPIGAAAFIVFEM
jgi:hypothetical protein